MTDGYLALRETAARIDLSSRGRIRVTGDDRLRLIHAMSTNHVQGLRPGAGCYAFFLNAVGRIQADASILCFEDHLLLDVEPESRAFLIEHLDKFIIAEDVVLEDITPTTFAVGIEGPDAEGVVRDGQLPVPDGALMHASAGPLTVIRASFTGAPGFRIIGTGGMETPFPMVPAASPDAANAVRLEHFFPRFGDDITSAHLPQETGLNDALHFNKGCYLGQEIVERVRSRGHVNRILVGLRIGGQDPLPPGSKVVYEGAEVGETTSSAFSPALGATLAMAYVRVNAAKPDTQVQIGDRAAQVAAIKSSRT